MKLLCVVHRYGPGVTGGSEAHCRGIAQHLAAQHDVTVATSCAEDYITWANVFPSGPATDGPVRVLRFPVVRQRNLPRFWALSDRVFEERATGDEQREWFEANGPELPGLIEFLRASPTPFHATASLANRLQAAGYQRLDERDAWQLEPGGRYYVTRNDSSLVAFQIGSRTLLEGGLRLVGAHTDSPCLRVKPQPDLQRKCFEPPQGT